MCCFGDREVGLLVVGLSAEQAAVLAATQRPVAELVFSLPNEAPAWNDLPSWAVVATADKAAGTDVVRSMAARAGATITAVEGWHVIMISEPRAVTDVILEAAAASSASGEQMSRSAGRELHHRMSSAGANPQRLETK